MTLTAKKYRKEPVVIEAMQWDGTEADAHAIIAWMGGNADAQHIYEEPVRIVIRTLEGPIAASPVDWIIKGVQGEFYPCKPDIFAATYEAV